MHQDFNLWSSEVKANCIAFIANLPADDTFVIVIQKKEGARTKALRGAQHVYFKQMADSLNDAGFDQRAVLDRIKDTLDIPNTMHSIKALFRSIGAQMFGKASTEKLTNTETKETYLTFDRGMAIKFEISHPWPCKEAQDAESQGLKQ